MIGWVDRLDPSLPLCVDLDGTLIKETVTSQLALSFIGKNPLRFLQVLFWLCQSVRVLQKQLLSRLENKEICYHYHEPLLEFLTAQHQKGQSLFLVTGSDIRMTKPFLRDLGFFEDVLASTHSEYSLTGRHKARALVAKFGAKNFYYIGNAPADYFVWREAASPYFIVKSTFGLASAMKLLLPHGQWLNFSTYCVRTARTFKSTL